MMTRPVERDQDVKGLKIMRCKEQFGSWFGKIWSQENTVCVCVCVCVCVRAHTRVHWELI